MANYQLTTIFFAKYQLTVNPIRTLWVNLCTDVPLPQKKIGFLLREGDVFTQATSGLEERLTCIPGILRIVIDKAEVLWCLTNPLQKGFHANNWNSEKLR